MWTYAIPAVSLHMARWFSAFSLLLLAGCAMYPTPRTLSLRPESTQSEEQYTRDFADCKARTEAATQAARPFVPLEPQVFGLLGSLTQRDVERTFIWANMRQCLTARGHALQPSANSYEKDLKECTAWARGLLESGMSKYRNLCMQARGHAVDR